MTADGHSIVRALTADFQDHSRADGCQCGSAQAANQLSQEPEQSAPVATQSYGLTGGGEAGADPKPTTTEGDSHA
ncbi:hypothetical protein SEA_HOLLIDAY_57 [Gordonia phage Holliday]|nr:hypothetical protein SEA_HOLLIDAY_57 [Gordonia phage Holliday]